MTALTWDGIGERLYETGVDHGVLYSPDEDGAYTSGVAWNGLTAVNETPSGAEENAQYADNIKYLSLRSAEEFGATIEALTYPKEFAAHDGQATPTPGVVVGQQPRTPFGLAYRTRVGNDVAGDSLGYKLHLVYGASAAPSEKNYQTINDSPEAAAFSWEVTTVPVPVPDHSPSAILVIDSTEVDAGALATLEDILFGNEVDDPRLPMPGEVLDIFGGTALASNVVVAGDADSIDITGTPANYLFTVEQWDGDQWVEVEGGVEVNEAAAEALVLTNGLARVRLSAAPDYHVPSAQQDEFIVTVT